MPLTVDAASRQNQDNNVTITVQDVGDGKYDSAMFLASGTFAITRPTNTPLSPSGFQVGQWGPCSATCGLATRTREVVCQNAMGQTTPSSCAGMQQPTTTEQCPFLSCTAYSFAPGVPGACSATCGKAERQVPFTCVSDAGMNVALGLCGREVPEPNTEDCNLPDCVTYEYAVSEYGPCGVTCGSGLRTREVACLTDQKQQVGDFYCTGLVRPSTTEACEEEKCPFAELKVGEWGECSVTCGVGTARRAITCVDENGDQVSDGQCANMPRPSELKSCSFEPCQSYGYSFDPWGGCSVSCGEGVKTRRVFCVNALGQEVRQAACGAMIEPSREASCTTTSCNQYQYKALEWSSCSITCTSGTTQGVRDGSILAGRDQGTKTRVVYCVNQFDHIVSDGFCASGVRNDAVKPESFKACEEELPTCAQYNVRWTNFTECSATCGPSQRAREMICADADGKRVADDLCDPAQMSARNRIETTVCPTVPCDTYQFVADRWGDCDATCGSGVQSRDVSCQNMRTNEIVSDDLCPGAKVTRQTCTTLRPCATFTYSVDSWCTRDDDPCYNDNVKYTRNVKCLNSLGNEDREENCQAMVKPPSELTCNFDDAKDEICDCPKCEGGVPVPTNDPTAAPPPTVESSPIRIGLEKDFDQMTTSDKAKVAEDLAAKLGLTGCDSAVVVGDRVTVECEDGKKISGVFKDPNARRRASAGTIFEVTAQGVENLDEAVAGVNSLGGTGVTNPDGVNGGAMFEFTVEGIKHTDVDAITNDLEELGGQKVVDKVVMSTKSPTQSGTSGVPPPPTPVDPQEPVPTAAPVEMPSPVPPVPVPVTPAPVAPTPPITNPSPPSVIPPAPAVPSTPAPRPASPPSPIPGSSSAARVAGTLFSFISSAALLCSLLY